MALLNKTPAGYANTQAAADFLSKDSDRYIGYMIQHHHHLADSWIRMDEAVTRSGPIRDRSSVSSEEWREAFFNGYVQQCHGHGVGCGAVRGSVRVYPAAGYGRRARHLCHPFLQSQPAPDRCGVRPFHHPAVCRKTIERFGLSDRIRFVAGDYTTDDIPLKQDFDAAWLSHILHGEGPNLAEGIVAHAAEKLVPGGQLLIHDFILGDTRDRPEFAALFSLNMLLGTESGQSYSESEIRKMMTDAGLTDITLQDFTGPTQSRILKGIRPQDPGNES